MEIIIILKRKVMRISRGRKIDHFYSLFREGMTVLDVGVASEMKKGIPERNYFLKYFRYAPEYYTGLGIQDLSRMEELFPGKRFVQYPGGQFPFNDREFDWAFSNAAIEHVGNNETQIYFLNEMLRVADNVFFTTPNKYFPFESHANVMFLHWNTAMFQKWCEKYRSWLAPGNLNLLSCNRLRNILDISNASHYSIHKNRFLGLPMTLTVTCTAYTPG